MIAALVVIPIFVGCNPNTQTPPPVAVDNQPVKPQEPTVADSKKMEPKPEDTTASHVKGFVYESFEGATQIYYMKASSQDKIKLGQGGNSQPSWSPDGNTIAFVSSDGIICTMDIEGKNVKELKAGNNPIWSPDGKKIAFITKEDLSNSIWVMNADGTGLMDVSKGRSGWYFTPAWSPDGKRLAATCCITKDNLVFWSDVFVLNADGTGNNNITNTKLDSEISPCWSADGQYVAFLSNRNISENEGGAINSDCWNLYVTKIDGTEVRRVNTDFPGWTGYAGLSRNYKNPETGIVSVWDSTTEYNGPYTTWSPDGKYITVCTIRAQGPSLPRMNPFNTISKPPDQYVVGSLIIFDSQTGKEMTAVKAGKRTVSWSADSKRICYIPAAAQSSDLLLPYRQITARNLVIMDADGSNPQTIYDCNTDGYLSWHP